MSEEITKKLDEVSGEEIPFEEFVRRQLISISSRLTVLETGQAALHTEVVERFVQVSRHVKEVKDEIGITNENVHKLDDKLFKLSRQMRDLTDKVDLFVQEHLYLKRDVQDMQETLEQRH
jgi:septal ring factor EnvC (AmiA/AmiB activator)